MASRIPLDDDEIEAMIEERITERVFSEKPLPCPFCVSERVYVDTEQGYTPAVYCRDCHATCGKNVRSERDAIVAWNTRGGVRA